MALDPPPIQEVTADSKGRFPQVWIRWFTHVCAAITNNNFSNITIPAITANITLGNTDSTVLCDASGGIFTVTLPDVLEFSGFRYNIKKVDTSANDVTIDGDGANIDGAGTKLLSGSGYPSFYVQSDGTQWWVL